MKKLLPFIFILVPFLSNAQNDIELTFPYLSPTSAKPGDIVSTRVYIYNDSFEESSAFSLEYYLSQDAVYTPGLDTYISSDYVSPISGHIERIHESGIVIPTRATAGASYIIFVANVGSSMDDPNENNNVVSKAITIQANVTGTINSNNEDLKIQLYPNPAVEEIFIDGIEDNAELTIMNELGKTVYNNTINKFNRIDISALMEGIYMVKIKEGDKTVTRKLVVKN